MDTQAILTILDLMLLAVERGAAVQAKLAEVRDFVADKISNGESISAEEWGILRARMQLSDTILEDRAAEAREILSKG